MKEKMGHKTHNSSALAKQVSEKLGLDQAGGLELYKELTQVPDGRVKDALHALSAPDAALAEMDLEKEYPALHAKMVAAAGKKKDDAPRRFAACIRSSCVRDAQYAIHRDTAMEDDASWMDANDMELFLEIVEADTPTRAKQIAAAYAGVDESIIVLYPV